MDMLIFAGLVHLAIALANLLLAFFFINRVTFPQKRRAGWRVIVVLLFATIFFTSGAIANIDLAIEVFNSNPQKTGILLTNIGQAVGGLGFWLLGMKWVKVSFFDKKNFEELTKPIEDEIRKFHS